MTTVVTGAPGWLGTALVRRLRADGREVRCLVYTGHADSALSELRALGVEAMRGDILDRGSVRRAMRGASSVFHLAGELHPTSARLMDRVNAEGTTAVAEEASAAGAGRFVYVSSITIHGYNQSRTAPFDEHDEPAPPSVYARSKLAGELVVRELAEAGRLNAVALRPGPFYGPGGGRGMSLLVDLVKKMPIAVFGDGGQLRSLVHIENAVDALLLAEASTHQRGEAFLIGDAEPYSIRELLEAIAYAVDRPLRTFWAPEFLSVMSERASRVLERTAGYHSSLASMIGEFGHNVFCSIERARNELGYAPKRGLRQGIVDALTYR